MDSSWSAGNGQAVAYPAFTNEEPCSVDTNGGQLHSDRKTVWVWPGNGIGGQCPVILPAITGWYVPVGIPSNATITLLEGCAYITETRNRRYVEMDFRLI
jgi:hypothetical protein